MKVGQVNPTQLQRPKMRSADQLHLEEELTNSLSDQIDDALKLQAVSVKNEIFMPVKYELIFLLKCMH